MISINYLKLFSLFCAITLTSHNLFANPFTGNGNATANFVVPISVTSNTNMNFGTFSTEGLSINDTKTLTTSGTYGGGNLTNISNGGTAAVFSVTASQAADVWVNVVSGNSKVTLIDFVCKDGASDVNCDQGDGYSISANKTINVGATAKIVDSAGLSGTTQNPTYSITVNYQ